MTTVEVQFYDRVPKLLGDLVSSEIEKTNLLRKQVELLEKIEHTEQLLAQLLSNETYTETDS